MDYWTSSDINSCVRYSFEDDSVALTINHQLFTVALTINHQLFTHQGINELIQKLKELQTLLKEVDHGAV